MPTVLTDETLACLLEIAGLAVMDAQKAELRTIQESLAAMKARVRQPRGRMAESAHTIRLHGEGNRQGFTMSPAANGQPGAQPNDVLADKPRHEAEQAH